jgi:UDP-glucose 4-epimerase
MSANVLVTGGAGFIGSHVAEELVARGHHVTVLDDLSGGFTRNVPRECEFVAGSIGDEPLVERLFSTHRFSEVFHLAAYAAEGLSHFIRRFNYTNNVIGSMTLINAAVNHGARRFVFTSSIAVYGSAKPPMTETSTPRPEDPYGIAKHAVELDLQAASNMWGMEFAVLRPHNVYGERQNIADPYRNVIGIFMNELMHGREMPIFGDGSQTRAFTYIGDIAPLIVRAGFDTAAANQIVNIGADEAVSVSELAKLTADALGVPCRMSYGAARQEAQHAFADHERASRIFGPLASTPLRVGLARMAEWARAAGPLAPRGFEGIEIERGLPDRWRAIPAASAQGAKPV